MIDIVKNGQKMEDFRMSGSPIIANFVKFWIS